MTDTPASGGHRPVRRAALAFIFITVMLDILAIGVIIPVLPHLIQSFLGGDIGEAAHWVGIFGTCFALAQWLFSPLQGALSDHFGRRPVILLSNLGLGVDFLLMALVIAALAAEGTSEIGNIGQIDRGYERLEDKLLALRAHVERHSS